MDKPRILLQLDSDPLASAFDAVVAIDAGVDHLLQYHAVEPAQVRDLVYGAIFTRGADDLRRTAIFVGGSSVPAGEALVAAVCRTFLGPLRVSVMMDSNGANTTAAAAVLAAGAHGPLSEASVLVLGATGPVGQRVTRLLAQAGAPVRAASRVLSRADEVCAAVRSHLAEARVEPCVAGTPDEQAAALDGVSIVIAAGAAGRQLLSESTRRAASGLRVVVDLNAVPPYGLEGIDPRDRGSERGGVAAYGAIGVGGTKMKIHKAAVRRLFESNDAVLDAEQIFELGRQLAL